MMLEKILFKVGFKKKILRIINGSLALMPTTIKIFILTTFYIHSIFQTFGTYSANILL